MGLRITCIRTLKEARTDRYLIFLFSLVYHVIDESAFAGADGAHDGDVNWGTGNHFAFS